MSEQLELHTNAYQEHRKHAIDHLGKHTRKWIMFDGKRQSCQRVLREIMHDTETGKRFVRQTSTNPDVEL